MTTAKDPPIPKVLTEKRESLVADIFEIMGERLAEWRENPRAKVRETERPLWRHSGDD